MSRRPRSLAGALYLRIVLLVAATGLVMAVSSFTIADRAVDRASDNQLVTAANVLLALMQEELADGGPHASTRTMEVGDQLLSEEDARAFHASADWRMFFVFQNGRPVIQSDTAPDVALIPRDPGFHDFRAKDGKWRSYGLRGPRSGLLLVVGERLHSRHLIVRQMLMRLLVPLLALLPITAFLLRLSLRSGLASLRTLTGELSRRSSQDLARLDLWAWPRDLAGPVTALNRLFERLEEAMAREQGFTDDAAHQLRTPLAAIKVQAQTVVATLAEADRPLGRSLLAGVDRATALIDHMLQLARLEATAVVPVRFDVCAVATAMVADHALVAAHRRVEFDFRCTGPVTLVSDPAVLAVALAAVCENAVKHSPAGGTIAVAVEPHGPDGARIAIADQGRGIPAAERARLLDPFARGCGGEDGTGLGLPIARRALALLEGTLAFGDAEGVGLTVRIALPSLAAAS